MDEFLYHFTINQINQINRHLITIHHKAEKKNFLFGWAN